MKCQAITLKGKPCSRMAKIHVPDRGITGSKQCEQHAFSWWDKYHERCADKEKEAQEAQEKRMHGIKVIAMPGVTYNGHHSVDIAVYENDVLVSTFTSLDPETGWLKIIPLIIERAVQIGAKLRTRTVADRI